MFRKSGQTDRLIERVDNHADSVQRQNDELIARLDRAINWVSKMRQMCGKSWYPLSKSELDELAQILAGEKK